MLPHIPFSHFSEVCGGFQHFCLLNLYFLIIKVANLVWSLLPLNPLNVTLNSTINYLKSKKFSLTRDHLIKIYNLVSNFFTAIFKGFQNFNLWCHISIFAQFSEVCGVFQ
jgi:hypothetical protein